MARKVIDHIRKTDVVIEGGNDVIELVNAALSQRTPAMQGAPPTNSNPFGGF